ncbi:MAG: RAQPRD family integrative conjugative element protein [Ectopseudomonas guguanensis]|uniref:integrative conjugative element protein, RAQPRD family n=1 Tax=Ectopseudomonas guguanensis TaxID=1198456 RepID=UPI0039189D5E
MQPRSFIRRRHRYHMLVSLLLITTSTWTWASGNPQEIRELTLAIKQLENVQAILKRAEMQARATSRDLRTTRYEFDYELVQSDLQRISEGVRGYLSPSRAQPRDFADIAGDYSRDRVVP